MDKHKLIKLGSFVGIITAVGIALKKREEKKAEQEVIDVTPEKVEDKSSQV